ncbi:MAG: GyrI-like domain-containing protein [Spirochaetes bacterium]|nr:GyrI-like domain-containing protein [Spirochaetota bacterium]
MEIQTRDEQRTIAIKATTDVKELPNVLGQGYGEIMQYLEQKGLEPTGAPFVLYFNEDMENLQLEMGFPISTKIESQGRIIPSTLPGGPCVVAMHIGPYTDLERTYTELMDYAKQQNRTPSGIGYEVYLNDPQTTKPEELQTEIVFYLKD